MIKKIYQHNLAVVAALKALAKDPERYSAGQIALRLNSSIALIPYLNPPMTRMSVMGLLRRQGIPLGAAKGPSLTGGTPRKGAVPRFRWHRAVRSEAEPIAPAAQETPAPVEAIQPPATPPPPAGSPVDIMQLTAHTCRWPLGEGPPFMYCGAAPEAAGAPYCGEHAALAGGGGKGRNRAQWILGERAKLRIAREKTAQTGT